MFGNKKLEKRIEELENRVKKLEDKVFAPAASQDELYAMAEELVKRYERASPALIQRNLKIGYARASRLIDLLEESGVVSSAIGSEPRKVLKK